MSTQIEDEGHGPKYGCNYQACGSSDASARCPFVKDTPSPSRNLKELARSIEMSDLKVKAALVDELADVLTRILEHH